MLSFAQSAYPERHIDLIIGNAPGGSSDVVSRALIKSLEPLLGKPIKITYTVGASGSIAAKNLINAKPDGHTLMLGAMSTLTVGPHCLEKLPFDSTKDITPVAIFSHVPNIMAVNKTFPANDFTSFLKVVKDQPGKYNYGAQFCTQFWLMGELLKTKTQINMMFIPYSSMAQGRTATLANDVQIIVDTAVIMPNIEAGQFKAMAVASNRRLRTLPEVPTFLELGIPEANIVNWYGIVAPPGTPKHIVDLLNNAIQKAAQDPELISLLRSWHGDVQHLGPDDFTKLIKKEWDLYGKVVAKAKKNSDK